MVSEVVLRKLTIADHTVTVVDHALRGLESWRFEIERIWVVDLHWPQNRLWTFLHEDALLQVLEMRAGVKGPPPVR